MVNKSKFGSFLVGQNNFSKRNKISKIVKVNKQYDSKYTLIQSTVL